MISWDFIKKGTKKHKIYKIEELSFNIVKFVH